MDSRTISQRTHPRRENVEESAPAREALLISTHVSDQAAWQASTRQSRLPRVNTYSSYTSMVSVPPANPASGHTHTARTGQPISPCSGRARNSREVTSWLFPRIARNPAIAPLRPRDEVRALSGRTLGARSAAERTVARVRRSWLWRPAPSWPHGRTAQRCPSPPAGERVTYSHVRRDVWRPPARSPRNPYAECRLITTTVRAPMVVDSGPLTDVDGRESRTWRG